MGVTIDAITGTDLTVQIKANIPGAFQVNNADRQESHNGNRCMPIGAAEIIEQIIEAARGNKIDVLRIWGHGVTHYTDGSDFGKGNIILGKERIEADNVNIKWQVLRRLTPHFAPNARVELRGCQAAVGTGQIMMKELAKIWNAEVHGANGSQFGPTWAPPVYAAFPDGRFGKAATVEYNDPPAVRR